MGATFRGVRRVLEASVFRKGNLLVAGKIEKVLPDKTLFEYHLVTICLPGVLIALVVAALYIKERNKKP